MLFSIKTLSRKRTINDLEISIPSRFTRIPGASVGNNETNLESYATEKLKKMKANSPKIGAIQFGFYCIL